MPCGWGVKAGMIRVWVAGITLCDPLVTHGSYLSALSVVLPITRRYTNNQITLTLTLSPHRRPSKLHDRLGLRLNS